MFELTAFLMLFIHVICMEDLSTYSIVKSIIMYSLTMLMLYYIHRYQKKEEREKWIREYLEKHSKD